MNLINSLFICPNCKNILKIDNLNKSHNFSCECGEEFRIKNKILIFEKYP